MNYLLAIPLFVLIAFIVGLIIVIYKTSGHDILANLPSQFYVSLNKYWTADKKIFFIIMTIYILGSIWSPILFFLKVSITFTTLNHINNIINTDNREILKINLNNIIALITGLFVITGLVFINIKDLLNPINSPQGSNNQQPGNNPNQPPRIPPKLPAPVYYGW